MAKYSIYKPAVMYEHTCNVILGSIYLFLQHQSTGMYYVTTVLNYVKLQRMMVKFDAEANENSS